MREFLKLCGFETGDIEKELPRIEKAFDRLGLTPGDIEKGKQRLHKYYDIDLQGVRRAIGLSLLEVVDTVLAREEGKKKIIYGFMCTGYETIATAVVSKSEEIYASYTPWTFQFVLGCIFDKIVPVLEAAEQRWLKSGQVAHCGNGKTLVGLIALGLIPKPDLLITSGQLCDIAPKNIDLLHELYDVPIATYDTCQDRNYFKEYPSSKRVIDLLAESTRQFVHHKLQEVVGFKITDTMMMDAINARNDLRQAMLQIQNLMESSDPLPLSPTHENLFACLGALPRSPTGLKKPVEVLNAVYKDVIQNRVNKGKGVVEKGSPRIFSVCPHNSADPRQEHLLCEIGIASVGSEAAFFPSHGNRYLDTDEAKSQDPYEILSIGQHRSVDQDVDARTAILIEVCRRTQVDGALVRYHTGCRRLVGDAVIMKDEITKQLGIPSLLLEWESFDPRVYHETQLKKRLELFKDLMTNKKQHQK
jgi:hypothetical protein